MLVDLGLANFYHPGRAYNEIVALHSTMYHQPLASKRRMTPGLLFCLSSMVTLSHNPDIVMMVGAAWQQRTDMVMMS